MKGMGWGIIGMSVALLASSALRMDLPRGFTDPVEQLLPMPGGRGSASSSSGYLSPGGRAHRRWRQRRAAGRAR